MSQLRKTIGQLNLAFMLPSTTNTRLLRLKNISKAVLAGHSQTNIFKILWRCGRVVEGNSLENCRARKGTVSSNPTASANTTYYRINPCTSQKWATRVPCLPAGRLKKLKIKGAIFCRSFIFLYSSIRVIFLSL